MASVNKVILIGNLGRDPESRHMPSGEQVVNIALATTDSWKDKNGEKQERTEWHRIVIFGKLADIAAQYLRKGSPVYFEGSLRTRKWQNKEGQDQYTTEIVADKMQMLGSRSSGGSAPMDDDDFGRSSARSSSSPQAGSSNRQQPAQRQNAQPEYGDLPDDDIPF